MLADRQSCIVLIAAGRDVPLRDLADARADFDAALLAPLTPSAEDLEQEELMRALGLR